MPRSVIDHTALSLRPDFALLYLIGKLSVIPVAEPDDALLAYTGKMLIHAVGYPDAPDDAKACFDLLRSYGVDPDDMAGNALHGFVTIKSIQPYQPIDFALDGKNALHPFGDDLAAFQRDADLIGFPVHRIEVWKPGLFQEPVFDVYPVEGIEQWEIWFPDDPLMMTAFKLAIDSNRALVPDLSKK